MSKPDLRIVPCPTCKKSVSWNDKSPFRPFCSERCKLIDLGEWADERRRIPGKSVVTDEGEAEFTEEME